MKKYFTLWLTFVLLITTSVITYAKCKTSEDVLIKNRLFSITIPKELSGTYETKIEKDKISIIHKDSQKAGFGGFAFGIKAYKNPADHAILPGSRKLGELTDKRGQLYDIVLKYPTDVQYDYTKNKEAPEPFKLLYDLGGTINIQGVNGAVYHNQQGTKGEDLYKEVLERLVNIIKTKPDSTELEKQDLSYMYNVIANSGDNTNILDKVGYTYYDLNADGIDELLIGEIAEGFWKGVIYDIYTMVDRKPKHVISGGARNRYFVCDNTFICNEYSNGADESGVRTYILVENSTELYPQVSFKYDGYQDTESPWFISYGSEIDDDKWQNVSKQAYDERLAVFKKYERFDYTPLSEMR